MKLWLKGAIVAGFVVGLFFLLPTHKCGDDEPDAQLEALTKKADAGDMAAITAILEKDRRDGVEPLVAYWTLMGALHGNKQLCKEYLERYASFTRDQQLRMIEVVSGKQSMAGADCLLKGMKAK